MKMKLICVTVLSALMLFGEAPLKRQPARAPKPAVVQPAELNNAIKALENGEPQDVIIPPASESEALPKAAPGKAPKNWKPTPLVVPETAHRAVSASSEWVQAKLTPVPGADGRVLFTFGEGLPVVTCAPLKLTVIELQAGEHIIGAPQIGDSVRWNIMPAFTGKDMKLTPLLVIKPSAAGLDTNLVVATDHRAYYIRLISVKEEYVPRVAFNYPADIAETWKEELAKDRKKVADDAISQPIKEPVVRQPSIADFGHNYEIRGKDKEIRPVFVMDDGAKTIFKMPAGLQVRDAPALVIIDKAGKEETVNYRVVGDTYVVDRLAEHFALLLGIGKHRQRVDILRNPTADSK